MTKGISALSAHLFRHVRKSGEDGVALLSTILFMILLAGLSLVLLSTIISQYNASYGAVKSTKTVNASQAGLQVALGVIRSVATAPDASGDIYGITSELPCDTLTGKVDGENADVTYSVEVAYYQEDPTDKSDSWRFTNKMACYPGNGPSVGGVSTQPKFAVVTSEGLAPSREGTSDTEGNRTIAAVYQFRVTNVNIPGGRIYNFDKTKCLEAQGAYSGSEMKFVNASHCTDDKQDVQLWIYDDDYQIKLASSTVGGGSALCISDPLDGYTERAELRTCRTSSHWSLYAQLWSWTGDHSWRGQKSPISNGVSNICLTSSGNWLQVKEGCDGGFAPTPMVGAGAAGKATNQIVNYKEFGRCLDVTGENINADYMIAYPCKQDPTAGQTFLKWNHKWYYSEPPVGSTTLADQQIYVYDNGGNKRCLESSPAGNWNDNPRFKACSSSNAAQHWTRVQKTEDYASSYVFIDYLGRCLNADSTETLDGNWSWINVIDCNGTPAQKWNAPATANDATFGSFKEIHG